MREQKLLSHPLVSHYLKQQTLFFRRLHRKERLIRYCARPAFSGEKLTVLSGKGESAAGLKLQYDVNKNSEKTDLPMILTATELFDSLAKLIPPPRRHRHHYHGVLSANSKYRSEVTRFANKPFTPEESKSKAETVLDEIKEFTATTVTIQSSSKSSQTWAKLIIKVYEINPLLCEQCGNELKLIAFITDGVSIRKILSHLGEAIEPPIIRQARGPPDECQDSPAEEGIDAENDYDFNQSYNE